MRYYIADLHFFHGVLNNAMDNRGFASTEEMNEYMIKQWNSKVGKHDEVVILGDFSVEKGEKTNEILSRLNGIKYLVVGNHDKYIDDKEFDRAHFKWIENYRELRDSKRKVILSHYPIACYNGQYHRGEGGVFKTYMLYGHVHDTYDERLLEYFREYATGCRRLTKHNEEINIPCQMINCFCGYSDYVPLTLDEWIENDRNRRNITEE